MAEKKKRLKKRIKQWLMLWLVPPVAYVFFNLLYFSLRKELRNADELLERWKRGEPSIIVLWHNRALLCSPFYRWTLRGGRAVLLASQSSEGVLASRIFRLFGGKIAWGSSTRGGKEGLEDMIAFGREGYNLAIAPDGPRGPLYQARPGAVRIAKETGLPVYPAAYYPEKVTRLNSWDRFIIPHPFSRILFMLGKPVYVPPDADEEMIEQKRRELEEELRRVSEFTEKYYSDEDKKAF